MSMSLKHVIYWGVGALALIALAGPYPDMATILAVILVTGVLLAHTSEYLSIFNQSTPKG